MENWGLIIHDPWTLLSHPNASERAMADPSMNYQNDLICQIVAHEVWYQFRKLLADLCGRMDPCWPNFKKIVKGRNCDFLLA